MFCIYAVSSNFLCILLKLFCIFDLFANLKPRLNKFLFPPLYIVFSNISPCIIYVDKHNVNNGQTLDHPIRSSWKILIWPRCQFLVDNLFLVLIMWSILLV